jgi:hypothetical protein
MNRDRAAILLAFHDETEVLTKRAILDRAGLREDMQLNYLISMNLIAMREWQPKERRLLFLTPKGRDKRGECMVGD